MAAYSFAATMLAAAWVLSSVWRTRDPVVAYAMLFVVMTLSAVAAAPRAARAQWFRAMLYGIAAAIALHACVLLASYGAALLLPASLWISHRTAVQLITLAGASPIFLAALWPVWRWLAPRAV